MNRGGGRRVERDEGGDLFALKDDANRLIRDRSTDVLSILLTPEAAFGQGLRLELQAAADCLAPVVIQAEASFRVCSKRWPPDLLPQPSVVRLAAYGSSSGRACGRR